MTLLTMTIVDPNVKFTCNGITIPALRRADQWKYLGVPFTPEGRLLGDPIGKLRADLYTLKRAPLKPQQRLFVLRTVVLPGLYHLLALGMTNLSLLNKLDVMVRTSVRGWLRLPQDVHNSYFHADVKDGGLSLPSFRWVIPLQRLHRLRNLKIFEDGEVPEEIKVFARNEVKRVQQRLFDLGLQIETKAQYKQRFAKLLHGSNDGKPLKDSRSVEGQHRWITDGNLFVSGRDFIEMNRLRINAIPLRVRMARGQVRDRHCRAGCNDGETLHHVLQICFRTHPERIKRHDACLEYLVRRLQKGDITSKEPRLRTPMGMLKPDLIIKRGSTAIVVDALIAGERADLHQAHQGKITKYSVLEPVIKERYDVDRVVFTSLTISARGVWSKHSFEHLKSLHLLKASDAKILSTRVLLGGILALNQFARTTGVMRRRQQTR